MIFLFFTDKSIIGLFSYFLFFKVYFMLYVYFLLSICVFSSLSAYAFSLPLHSQNTHRLKATGLYRTSEVWYREYFSGNWKFTMKNKMVEWVLKYKKLTLLYKPDTLKSWNRSLHYSVSIFLLQSSSHLRWEILLDWYCMYFPTLGNTDIVFYFAVENSYTILNY